MFQCELMQEFESYKVAIDFNEAKILCVATQYCSVLYCSVLYYTMLYYTGQLEYGSTYC